MEEKSCCHTHEDTCCCEHHHHDHDTCCCGHGHDGCNCGHQHGKELNKVQLIFAGVSAVFMVLGYIAVFPKEVQFACFLASALFSGYPLFPAATRSLRHLRLDENLLMLISVIAAFSIGEFAEAAAVSLFFRVGESIEDYAVLRSKRSIEKLYKIRPEHAVRVKEDGSTENIHADDVAVNDILLVSPFEKIPVDCVVLEGNSAVDASAITGEAVPIAAECGTELLSGSINGAQVLKVKATMAFEDSAASKIIEAVQNAAEKKSQTDKFITRFAKYYTPIVVGSAVLIAVIPSIVFGSPAEYIHRALIFLVTSCPCALVLSVPLGFFSSIGGLSKKGVLVKGGKYIEALSKADCVLFDKTGTLTDNQFEIESIYAQEGYKKEQVLSIAAHAEKYSTHPLAQAVCAAAPAVDETKISNFSEVVGSGTEISLENKKVLCGSLKFLKLNHIAMEDAPTGAQIYVAVEDKFIGALFLGGKLRPTAKETVKELKAIGMKKIIMLTGDNEIAAKRTAEKCGIVDFKAGLLPTQKTELLKELQGKSLHPVFVGDGINDTPTLASAEVGVAMGTGTAAAIEAGDVVLMNSNPQNLVPAIKNSRRAMRVIRWNIIFSLSVKLLVLLLGAIGYAPIWAAIFADVGVCVLAVLNSARLLKAK